MKKVFLGIFIVGSIYVIHHDKYIPRVDTSKMGLKYTDTILKLPKFKSKEDFLEETIRKGELKLKEKELIEKEKEKKLKNKNNYKKATRKKIDFIISFYTNLPCENGGYTTTKYGEKLQYGIVASNVYSPGTKIHLDGYGDFTVSDTGSSHFDNPNRLDVLIEPKPGEDDTTYINRVNNMGKPHVVGYITNRR
ncbi:MAG: hypothetical protein RR942_01460 [Romboutsia sp.]